MLFVHLEAELNKVEKPLQEQSTKNIKANLVNPLYIYIENGSKVINTNLNSQEVQHLKCSLIVAIIQQQ